VTAFDRAPFIVIWETTRACALACVHCRAEAIARRHPDELTTGEGRRLMERVRAFGDPPPIFVLTGGDPLRRPDVAELVAYGTGLGLTVSMTPSGTAAVTEARLAALRDAGLARLAISLDGATEAVHDAFRRVRGSHRYTMRIVDRAKALGLPLQINTTVSRLTVADLPALARQMEDYGVALWALFFLVPVGRAQADQALSALEIEDVLRWAADLALRAPFGVKTTEAPQYHRVLAGRGARRAAAGRPGPPVRGGPPDFIGRAGRAVTDGNGFVFIDHVGNVCPSGFLPMPAGNVRSADLVALYREAPLFVALRDAERLGGRCGVCPHRATCGGSRARAYAATGDPFAEDPGCAFEPPGPGAPARGALPFASAT
jgi:AdoMet-dependent heme synthase